MGNYSAYGLTIQSDLPLPEVFPGDGPVDISIRLVPSLWGVLREKIRTGEQSGWQKIDRSEAELYVEGTGFFLLKDGREITIAPAPTARETALRLFLTGIVMAGILYQRGLLVLHASTVQMKQTALAFMGGSGWGKSSLAAALFLKGYGLVADDITVLATNGQDVLPGIPRVKIGADTASVLGMPFASVMDLLEQKSQLPTFERTAIHPIPLEKIYIIEDGDNLEILPMDPKESLFELIRHSFPTRLGKAGDSQHFQQCGLLARNVKMFHLVRPDKLAGLKELAGFIEEDLVEG
jgi:hypothetical protein